MTVYHDGHGKFWRNRKCRCKEGLLFNVRWDGRPTYIGDLPHEDGDYPRDIDYSVCNCGFEQCWTDQCNCDSCRVTDGSLFLANGAYCSNIGGLWGERFIRRIVTINTYNAMPVFACAYTGGACGVERILIEGDRVLVQTYHKECNPWDLSRYGNEHRVDVYVVCRKVGGECRRQYEYTGNDTQGMNTDMWRIPDFRKGRQNMSLQNDIDFLINDEYANAPYKAPYDEPIVDDDFE